jgi:hypothetical protein
MTARVRSIVERALIEGSIHRQPREMNDSTWFDDEVEFRRSPKEDVFDERSNHENNDNDAEQVPPTHTPHERIVHESLSLVRDGAL